LKTEIKPALSMPSGGPSTSAKVCGAKTRLGPCQEACEPNRRRCRLHGGAPGSGAPHGARNGRYVSGKHTKEAKAERRWVRTILGKVTGKDAMQEASSLELVDGHATAPIASQPGRRVSAQIYQSGGAGEFSARPPAGETRKDWLLKLKRALGSRSGAFVEASLRRLLVACTLPGRYIPTTTSVSAALALIESMEPRTNSKPSSRLTSLASLPLAATCWPKWHGIRAQAKWPWPQAACQSLSAHSTPRSPCIIASSTATGRSSGSNGW